MMCPIDWKSERKDLTQDLLLDIISDLEDALQYIVSPMHITDAASDLLHEAIESLIEAGEISQVPQSDDILSVHEKWCKESEEKITLKIRELMGVYNGDSYMES
jgi:septum formation inhibitor-activating ATPase MinD